LRDLRVEGLGFVVRHLLDGSPDVADANVNARFPDPRVRRVLKLRVLGVHISGFGINDFGARVMGFVFFSLGFDSVEGYGCVL